MDKIKNWIIRKLGGIVYYDLPVRIRRDILEYYNVKTINFQIANMLKNSHQTNYTNK